MLTALDALIQNGTGGRQTLVLRQICSLFMKVGFVGEDSTTDLFDEVMANLAVDLDDEVVTFLAPEVQQIAGLLPAFRSTIASRSFEIHARKAAPLDAVREPEIRTPADTSTPVDQASGMFAELARYASDAEKEFAPQSRHMALPEVAEDNVSEKRDQGTAPDAEGMYQDDVFDSAAPAIAEAGKTESDLIYKGSLETGPEQTETVGFPEAPEAKAKPHLLEDTAESAAPVIEKQKPAPGTPFERRTMARNPADDAANPITLARKASPAELVQIASVSHLPETLTNVIIMRGEREAIVKALQNKTAKFSRSSLTTLAELAPSDFMIKQALVCRNDLPELIIERILPFLNIESKARLLISGALFGEKEARAALEQANGDLVNAYRGGQMLFGVDTCMSSLKDGSMSVDDVVCMFAGELRMAELAMFASRILGLSLSTTMNMLAGRIDRAAGILAAALQCDRRAVTAVMDMRRRCGAMSDARGAIETHLRTGPDEALALVRQIDQLSSELEIVVPAEATADLHSRAA